MTDPEQPADSWSEPWRRTVFVLAAVLLAGLFATAFWYAADFFFLLFTSVLFAILLNRLANATAARTPLSRGWSLGLLVMAMLTTTVVLIVCFGFQLANRIEKTSQQFDRGGAVLREKLQKYPTLKSSLTGVPWLGMLLEKPDDADSQDESKSDSDSSSSPAEEQLASAGEKEDSAKASNSTDNQDESSQDNRAESDNGSSDSKTSDSKTSDSKSSDSKSSGGKASGFGSAAQGVARLFTTTFGAVMNVLIVLVLSVYFASNPDKYRSGMIRLVPLDRRERAGEILDLLEKALRRWLLGRLATMVLTGLFTGASLWLLGIPMAFTVGVLTALLTFIPNIGAAAAMLMATLLAAPQGLTTVGMVLGLYLAAQFLESYLLTPMIQQHQVSLPPGLLIAFQAAIGMMFGFLGVMVASPLLAALMVLINELYVRDTLGDPDPPMIVETESSS
ncbi:AI-2E family transporter [Lignipirellula cremea]|uniref:Pheromone autoinducer 2 transporter n=1 Tax=Lignipirellula cremea TaxID=2528010 RepID=A0A518E4T3_9BACT|nr:AI-2E family transporter [Lignipirellula cremea]QDU99092.1 hypothetical protein Pla8534_70030 [Lignipirellula cremea]